MAITQHCDEQEHGLVVGPHSQAPHNDLYIFVSKKMEIALGAIRILG